MVRQYMWHMYLLTKLPTCTCTYLVVLALVWHCVLLLFVI